MQTIAIVNEKGGTGKTTTAVNLSAALGKIGRKVLLVDLDGQAASSRWLGVEDDPRLADAMLAGGGLVPIESVAEGVDLAPACGKLDSIAHDLRPTQGGQLRMVLAELEDRYDYVLIDCPPSLGNRLIGNALLAATHAIVPVEPSILALDGLRILLTTLDDVRDGFGHDIELIGIVACRYETRTRLSRLVLAELNRGLPGKVFATKVRETVRMQECPASGKSILEYAPQSNASKDYQELAVELDTGGPPPAETSSIDGDLADDAELTCEDKNTVFDFRAKASAALFGDRKSGSAKKADTVAQQPEGQSENVETLEVPAEPVLAADAEPHPSQDHDNICHTEHIDLYHDDDPEPVDETDPVIEDPDDTDQELAEEILAEMPTVFDPNEPDAGAEEIVACDDHQTVPFDQAGCDQNDQPEIESVDRSSHTKVAGSIGVALVVLATASGWFALRPAGTTSSARANISPAPHQTNQLIQSDEESFPRPKQQDQSALAMPSNDTASQVSVDTQPSSAVSNEAARLPSAATASTEVGPMSSPAQLETSAQQATKDAPAQEEPSRGFIVTCILLGSAEGRAVINGTTLALGEIIDQAKLVQILPDSVEMLKQGQRFILSLSKTILSSDSIADYQVRAQ